MCKYGVEIFRGHLHLVMGQMVKDFQVSSTRPEFGP